MADIEYIVPSGGIINDTEEGSAPIIPGVGIYNEQAAAAAEGPPPALKVIGPF